MEHGFGAGETGTVQVQADRQDEHLLITVRDDGRGLPPDFDPRRTGNLGLQIVRTLVVGELGGVFDMVPGEERGTRITLDIPIDVPAQQQ
jgi:two-component system, sensor histidine kinase PdtaS